MNPQTLKPRTSRVVLYFVAIFAAVAGPTIVPWMFILFGPPAYSLTQSALPAGWQQPVTTPDGVSVSAGQYPSDDAAWKAMSETSDALETTLASTGPGIFRYRLADTQARGIILRAGSVVVRAEGADAAAVERAVESLPFLERNPTSADRWLHAIFEEHLAGFFVGLGIYVVLVAIAMFRGGAWAARISPPAGVAPVAIEELRRRLLAVNGLDVPFKVREGKRGYLVAEWKLADARWTELLEKGGLSIAHWVKLKLDGEHHLVRAIDFSRRVNWSAGVPRAAFSFSFFRGITFAEIESGSAHGLLFKDGAWTVDRAYQYAYDLNELKAPIVAAVVTSGWTYQPVAFFLPLLG